MLSSIGLGCMGMSHGYDPKNRNDEESLATIEAALNQGINFFDTSDIYGFGENEKLLAKAIKKFGREKFFIATKFALVQTPQGIVTDCSPEHVRIACEESLKRLEITTIDLYYMHRLDRNVPIENTVGAMSDLVKEGKVRYLGLSEVSADTLRRACKIHPITALQSEYSLWALDIESKILPTCRELGVAIVPYSPLGRGFLTGQIKKFEDLPEGDWRRTAPRFMGENFQKNIELVNKIEEIAKEKGCTAGQLALAWLLAQGDDMFPIPGTKRVKYLQENIDAINVKLSIDDLKRIRDLVTGFPIFGDRYAVMTSIDS